MNRAQYIERLDKMTRSVALLVDVALEAYTYTPEQRSDALDGLALCRTYTAWAEQAVSDIECQSYGTLCNSEAKKVELLVRRIADEQDKAENP